MVTKQLRPSPLMLAVAISASALAFPALSQAATATPATSPTSATQPMVTPKLARTASAKPSNEDSLAVKLSEDGFKAMRDIRMARVSIFEGDTQAAGDLVAQATQSLNAVDKVAAKDTANLKDDMLPIDGRIIVADDFVDTPAKHEHVGKANEHLKNGQPSKARDELRLAETEASFSRVLMPVDATRRQLNAAESLIKSNKFYDANLALKAAEDGLIVDTVAVTDLPTNTATQ